jgi:hypothetical protein
MLTKDEVALRDALDQLRGAAQLAYGRDGGVADWAPVHQFLGDYWRT